MNDTVRIPSEVGGRRYIVATVREKSTCKVCHQPILRLSNAKESIWTHERRVSGEAINHPARPVNGGRK